VFRYDATNSQNIFGYDDKLRTEVSQLTLDEREPQRWQPQRWQATEVAATEVALV